MSDVLNDLQLKRLGELVRASEWCARFLLTYFQIDVLG